MRLPLYQSEMLKNEPLIKQIGRGNAGLRFNKFFMHWGKDWRIEEGDKDKEGGKMRWIKTISEHLVGNRSLLSEAVERLINLVDNRGGEFRCYRTIWRFATGLGLNHPIENGMTWHHTLGVPYLPGSSFKGLVRAWVEQWLGLSDDEINRIFGSQETGSNNEKIGVGSIIFFDALPVAPVRLAADVMTPHYQKYYSGSEAPGDWQDPNPIPFLTVDEQQVFLFALAPRKIGVPENQSDIEKVWQWVDQALQNVGAGAKTAVGYGRFERCEQEENKLRTALMQRKEKQEAEKASTIPPQLSGPIADEMLKDQYDADPDKFLNILKTKWINKMQSDDTSPEDQKKIALLLKNWYQVHREGQWEKPNKKNAPIIEAIRKTLGEIA
ncbi:MAG: type III-B CRISPR module RAMP protein Cmr6 [Dethiobacteria bacterium]|nr:type III-B CRISPR module RAMP protein Cmr6 [Bacillota bacterium]